MQKFMANGHTPATTFNAAHTGYGIYTSHRTLRIQAHVYMNVHVCTCRMHIIPFSFLVHKLDMHFSYREYNLIFELSHLKSFFISSASSIVLWSHATSRTVQLCAIKQYVQPTLFIQFLSSLKHTTDSKNLQRVIQESPNNYWWMFQV